jgi:hypothetical protein
MLHFLLLRKSGEEKPMRARTLRKKATKATAEQRRQVNIRVDSSLYRTLQTLAEQERRSVPQTALHLLENGLRQRARGQVIPDDTPSQDIAALAAAGGAFDWLADEPDVYDDTCGEPL